MRIKDESPATYSAIAREERTIAKALKIINKRLREPGAALTSPDLTRSYLGIAIGADSFESFLVIYLDNQHRVIEIVTEFRGTIDGCSVHDRVIAKRALDLNAAAVIFAHNHPSGMIEPSQADKQITDKLKQALCLFDVRVLDHIIVGGGISYSFAEHGLL